MITTCDKCRHHIKATRKCSLDMLKGEVKPDDFCSHAEPLPDPWICPDCGEPLLETLQQDIIISMAVSVYPTLDSHGGIVLELEEQADHDMIESEVEHYVIQHGVPKEFYCFNCDKKFSLEEVVDILRKARQANAVI